MQERPAASVQSRPQAQARQASREELLVETLDRLIVNSPDIQAAALVSLDGFTMASALPQGMQEDRVGAMSAAILGLGERAAAELGRGHLSQVFIEGADGYVLLMAAGDRAVLTALASAEAKLGLVLYDMREISVRIGEILG
jgi:predicted regulator of Ras-like GTPase activity (Roadblock/LC7/MglB family)